MTAHVHGAHRQAQANTSSLSSAKSARVPLQVAGTNNVKIPDLTFFAHVVADALVVNRGDKLEGYQPHKCAEFLPAFLQQHNLHLEFVPLFERTAYFAKKMHELQNTLTLLSKKQEPQARLEPDIPAHFRTAFAQFIKEVRAEIMLGKPLVLVGGTCSSDLAGHALLYEWKKQSNGLFSASIYNTGLGTEAYHRFQIVDEKKKVVPVVTFRDIPSDAVTVRFLTHLFEPNLLACWNKNSRINSIARCYEPFWAIGAQYSCLKETRYITPQRAGTCAFKVFMAYMHMQLEEPAYKKFHLLLKNYCFARADDVMDKAPEEARLLEQAALRKFAASVIKAYKKKQLTSDEKAAFTQNIELRARKVQAALQQAAPLVCFDRDCLEPLALKKQSQPFGFVTKQQHPRKVHKDAEALAQEERVALPRELQADSKQRAPLPKNLRRPVQMATLTEEIFALDDYVHEINASHGRPTEAMVALCDFFLSVQVPKIAEKDVWAAIPSKEIKNLMCALDRLSSFAFLFQDALGDEAKTLTVLVVMWTIQDRLVQLKGMPALEKYPQDLESIEKVLQIPGSYRFYELKVQETLQEALAYMTQRNNAKQEKHLTLFEKTDAFQQEIHIDSRALDINGDLNYIAGCLRSKLARSQQGSAFLQAIGEYYATWISPNERIVPSEYYLLRNMAFRVDRILKQNRNYKTYEIDRKAGEPSFCTEPNKLIVEIHNPSSEESDDEPEEQILRLKEREPIQTKIFELLHDGRVPFLLEQFPGMTRLQTERLGLLQQNPALIIGNILSLFKNYDLIKAEVKSDGTKDFSIQTFIEVLFFQYEILSKTIDNNAALAGDCEEWMQQGRDFFLAKFDYETALFFIFLEESSRSHFRQHPHDSYRQQTEQRRRLHAIIAESKDPAIHNYCHLLITLTYQACHLIEQDGTRDAWTAEETKEFFFSYHSVNYRIMREERLALFMMLSHKATARAYEMWPHYTLSRELAESLLLMRVEREGIARTRLIQPLDIQIEFPLIHSEANGLTLDLLENELEMRISLKEGLPESILNENNCPEYQKLFGSTLLPAQMVPEYDQSYQVTHQNEEYRLQLVGSHSSIHLQSICKKIENEWYRYSKDLIADANDDERVVKLSPKLQLFKGVAWHSSTLLKKQAPHALMKAGDGSTLRFQFSQPELAAYKAVKLDPKKYFFVDAVQKIAGAKYDLLNIDLLEKTVQAKNLKNLLRVFSRLGIPTSSMAVWGKKKKASFTVAEIELTSLGLHFDVRMDGEGKKQLFSREVPGFYVAESQEIKTLHHFPSFLLLVSAKGEKRALLRKAKITHDFSGAHFFQSIPSLKFRDGWHLYEVKDEALFSKNCEAKLHAAHLYFALHDDRRAAALLRDAGTTMRAFTDAEEAYLIGDKPGKLQNNSDQGARECGFQLIACALYYMNFAAFRAVEPSARSKERFEAVIYRLVPNLYDNYQDTRNNVPDALRLNEIEEAAIYPHTNDRDSNEYAFVTGEAFLPYSLVTLSQAQSWLTKLGLPVELSPFLEEYDPKTLFYREDDLVFSFYEYPDGEAQNLSELMRRFKIFYKMALDDTHVDEFYAMLFQFKAYQESFLYQALLFAASYPDKVPAAADLENATRESYQLFFGALAKSYKVTDERFELERKAPELQLISRQETRALPAFVPPKLVQLHVKKFHTIPLAQKIDFDSIFEKKQGSKDTTAMNFTIPKTASPLVEEWL